VSERPDLGATWKAEPDRRRASDDRHRLSVFRHLPQLRRVEQVTPGLGQAVLVVHVARRVDDRMLKDCSATDPLCRVLRRFSIQPRQEDHRADRPQNSLRAVAPVLFVELSDILVAQHNAAAPSSTNAQSLT
jgi:hypothetical protein